MDAVTYALCKNFTKKSLNGLGALKGSPCRIENVEHKNGKTIITFLWESSSGEEERTTISISDGTPIYEWEKEVTYNAGDLIIYGSSFYKCIIQNNDSDFDVTKWIEIGNSDSNAEQMEPITILQIDELFN